MPKEIKVKLYYSRENLLYLKDFVIEENTSIKELLMSIDIKSFLPEFDIHYGEIGVFGKIKTRDYIIKNGDRLEIYEPILIDPKERRKLIARKNKKA